MLRLAAGDCRPRTPQVEDWLIGQAVTALGLLGSVGENNAVVSGDLKTIADAKLSFCTRSIAAESLGRLDYSESRASSAAGTAAALAQFAIDACTEELECVRRTSIAVERGRLKQRLDAVLTKALEGIAELAKEPDQQLAGERGRSRS